MRRTKYGFILLVLVILESFVNDYAFCQQSREGAELISKMAPEFVGLTWLDHEPITLAKLRGQVILIRFWSADCSLCDRSASAFNYLHEKYGKVAERGVASEPHRAERLYSGASEGRSEWSGYKKYKQRGLLVLGIHHPKSTEARDIRYVKLAAKRLGFQFPIAQDTEWQTINRYWLSGTKRKYTSASFLIDSKGKFSLVHAGGVLSLNSKSFLEFDRTIDRLLKNKDRMNSEPD